MPISEIIFWLTGGCGVVWIGTVGGLAVGLRRLRPRLSDEQPFVTVLVPARNEERNIDRCLDALAAQDYRVDKREIVIVDDRSTDRTVEIVRGYSDKIPGLKLVPAGQTPSGVSPVKHAVMEGLANSSGEIILHTDSDCAPPPGWVTGMAARFVEDVDVVVGYSPLVSPPLNPPPETGGGKALHSDLPPETGGGDAATNTSPLHSAAGNQRGGALAAKVSTFDGFVNAVVSAGSIGLGRPSTAVGRNMAYRRTIWEKAGGFGDSVGHASGVDDLMLQRMTAAGGKVAFCADPSTHVPAVGSRTLAEWWRRKRRHLSVGTRYIPALTALSTALYMFNLGLVVSAVMATLGAIPWPWLATVWGVKVAFDGITLHKAYKLLYESKGLDKSAPTHRSDGLDKSAPTHRSDGLDKSAPTHRSDGLDKSAPTRYRWALPWLIGEIVSPLIFTLLVPMSLVGSVKWKERTLNR